MDVSTMDLLSARVALEADITDIDNQLRATRNIRWSRQQEFALRTRKAKCERQLEELNIQIKVYALIESECNDIFTGLELGDSRKQELLDQGLAILLGDVSLGSAKPGPRELAATDPDGDFVPRSKSSSMIGNVSSVSSVSSDDDEFYDADEGYSNFYTQGVESGDTLLTCGICESTWVYQTFGLVCPACHSDAKRAYNINDWSFQLAEPGSPAQEVEYQARCVSCFELVPARNTAVLECEDTYCNACLLILFELATERNTSIFPPSCCGKLIPIELGRQLMPKGKIKEFDLRVEELTIPNPTSCWKCGQFIRAMEIKAGIGTCVFCGEQTCSTCKAKQHEELLCPEDPHVKLLEGIALRAKWQRCGRCKNMVELSTGCFHMTCLCRYQFCYLCGAEWKRCSCPQFREEYLTHTNDAGLDGQGMEEPPGLGIPCGRYIWRCEHGRNCQTCGATYLPWVMRCARCERPVATCMRCINGNDDEIYD